MAASKPSSSTSHAHFSGPPAMPIARAPLSFAICPATEPTAPAAPDTTTVSPSCRSPTSSRPKYAVMPVMPSAPTWVLSGATPASTFSSWSPGSSAYSCAPSTPETWSPSAKRSSPDATTRPTPPARMTAPILTGGTYERPSFIQPRMAGSSDSSSVWTSTSPGPGSATGSSVWSHTSAVGSPDGRAARRTWRLVAFVMDGIMTT